ncbi:glucokinase [Leptolyngbya boryana NIES-2135]|jgi:glucokinase|uniref:Glucokinase n=1 Tax=Leptolyngbya boryana NIES-2135 TaxID=1973484 RepID=A0A1Z4JLN5_LEPBY|nr:MULTISPECIES: glucokinase [Leptolyngbya]BAY57636.1 glucokinase [Leptolyngbya boryana NIES-2135]MBD2367591.1 glucokinase [Leptolyngbya sp. FACHB-161]MBD2374115.1 glucokinase [Leptolyngbya sp. FACHB-238]MBD2398740.1 glucokinase [Leptolyngbya sp. FACHB-239]MBD2404964.1 glucokinase [Leptolyngbya sp. FACHB-402]
MALLLAGDIGGTKTILRLVEAQVDQTETAKSSLFEQRYVSRDFPDLVPMVEKFLQEAQQATGQSFAPEKACFGIAGPVVNNTSKVTNVGWMLEGDRLSEQLSIPKVSLINDFAAIGYGILALEPTDLHVLQQGQPKENAPIAVIGAGTGLGQGYLVHDGTAYQVFESEGGHADFAPRTELEFQMSRYLLDKLNIERISVERIVSGQGIIAIYQFLRDRDFAKESPEIAEIMHTWNSEIGREKTVDPAAAISQAALEQRDHLSEKTMQMFIDAYGAEAGNQALKLLPYGGLYIAGGIAAKVLPLMEEGSFVRSFQLKGRMRSLMEQVPIQIVLNPQVGLIGAALCASRL